MVGQQRYQTEAMGRINVCLRVRPHSWSAPSSLRSFNFDTSVSGQKALAMAREDGAVMSEAVRRCDALTLEQKQNVSQSVEGPFMWSPE